MGYSADSSMVRVDFFKSSGKWYCTEAIKWVGYKDISIHTAFINSLNAYRNGRFSGMQAVCLEPYHEFSHPISIILD